jgi:hypothetical protein
MAQRGDFRGGVFISYRRALSIEHAKKLYEVLKDHLGERRVFFDQQAIRHGAEFPEEIETALNQAHLVLIVIAPGWTEDIHTRAQNPSVDWVRSEAVITQSRRLAADPPEVRVVLVGEQRCRRSTNCQMICTGSRKSIHTPAGIDWHLDQSWVEDFLADIDAAVPRETTALDDACLNNLATACGTSVHERLKNWPDLEILSELKERWVRSFSVPGSVDPANALIELRSALESLNTDSRTALESLAAERRRGLQRDCVAIVAELLRLGACRLVARLRSWEFWAEFDVKGDPPPSPSAAAGSPPAPS